MALFEKLAELRKISDRHRRSDTFVLNGVEVKCSTIDSIEDAFIQSWAMGLAGEKSGFVSYYKMGVVALCIKKLDDFDLEQYAPDDFIETGEKTEAEMPVKKERFKLMLDLVRNMHPELMTWIFEKYSTMSMESALSLQQEITPEELESAPVPETSTVEPTLRALSGIEQEVQDDEEIKRQLAQRHEG